MAMPIITVTPSTAANAYKSVASGTATGADFGGVLQRAIEGTIDANKEAESLSTQAIAGGDPRPRGAGVPGHHENADLSAPRIPAKRRERPWAEMMSAPCCARA
jgi:hypothetical protein